MSEVHADQKSYEMYQLWKSRGASGKSKPGFF
jgi:hypothetical protein